jgi:hypothetical protein
LGHSFVYVPGLKVAPKSDEDEELTSSVPPETVKDVVDHTTAWALEREKAIGNVVLSRTPSLLHAYALLSLLKRRFAAAMVNHEESLVLAALDERLNRLKLREMALPIVAEQEAWRREQKSLDPDPDSNGDSKPDDAIDSHESKVEQGMKHLRLSKAGELSVSEEAAAAISREACRACIEALATVRRVSNNVALVTLVVGRVFREFVDESYRLNEPNPVVVSGFFKTADAIASRVTIGSDDAPDDSDVEAVFQVVPMSPGGVS